MKTAQTPGRKFGFAWNPRAAAPRLALLAAISGLAGGCGMELETGYKYRPLDDTSTQRRAYYASPFSPEKAAGDEKKQGGNPFHGPGLSPGS